MTHVFISYKHNVDEHDFLENLRQRLNSVGIMTWADTDIQAGEEWKPAIDKAIRDSFAVIVVMTEAARASEFVTYEWSYAMGLGKPIVPIMLKPTELHPKLKDLQYLDFTRPSTRPWDALQKRLTGLKSKTVPIIPRSEKSGVHRPSPKLLTHQPLIKDLDSILPKAREAAAQILGNARITEALPKLIELLQDKDQAVRIAAAGALGSIRNDQATPALMALVSRTDLGASTQFAAINALAQIHSRRAVEFLYSKYQEDRGNIDLMNALVKAVGAHNIKTLPSKTIADLKNMGQILFDDFEAGISQVSDHLNEAETDPIGFSSTDAARYMRYIEADQIRCTNLIAFFEQLRDHEKVKILKEYDFDWMRDTVEKLSGS